jgi:hypothetical protein
MYGGGVAVQCYIRDRTSQPQGHQLGLPAVNVGEAAIKFLNLALGLNPLAFLTMHSAVHFGLADIRVSQEISNLGPHPALKFGSGEVRAPTLGNTDLPPPAGAFETVDASAEVTYQTPVVFGAEQHSPKPIGALGVAGGIGFVPGQPPSHSLPVVSGDDGGHNREILQPMPSVEREWLGRRSVGSTLCRWTGIIAVSRSE